MKSPTLLSGQDTDTTRYGKTLVGLSGLDQPAVTQLAEWQPPFQNTMQFVAIVAKYPIATQCPVNADTPVADARHTSTRNTS